MLALIQQAITGLLSRAQSLVKKEEVCTKKTSTLSVEDPRCKLYFQVCSPGIIINAELSEEHRLAILRQSWNLSPEDTMKIILHCRDCRHSTNGKGLRKASFECLLLIREYAPVTYLMNLVQFIELGCFKDLLYLATKCSVRDQPMLGNQTFIELEYLSECIKQDLQTLETNLHTEPHEQLAISLAAKWAPSEHKKFNHLVNPLRKLLRMNKKEYRQAISKLRAELPIVERKLCAKDWETIEVEKIPITARNKLRDTLKKHCSQQYSRYITSVKSSFNQVSPPTDQVVFKTIQLLGKVIGTKALVDVDATTAWTQSIETCMNMSWLRETLVVCNLQVCKLKDTVFPLGLAMMITAVGYQRMISPGQPYTLRTFTEFDSIQSMINQIRTMSSQFGKQKFDLDEMFNLIYDTFGASNAPKTLLILSDQPFETSCKSAFNKGKKHYDTAFERAEEKFGVSQVPNVVYWNVCPVKDYCIPVEEFQPGVFLFKGDAVQQQMLVDMYLYHDPTRNKLWNFVSSCLEVYQVSTEPLEHNNTFQTQKIKA
jgi:hypothetical protein